MTTNRISRKKFLQPIDTTKEGEAMTAEKRKFWWNVWCLTMSALFFLYVWLFGYQASMAKYVGIAVGFYAIIFGMHKICAPTDLSSPPMFVKVSKAAFIFFSSNWMLGFWIAVVPKDLQTLIFFIVALVTLLVAPTLVRLLHDYLDLKFDDSPKKTP